MSGWGKNDVSSNAVLWAASAISKGSGRANIAANNTALFANNTISAFIPNQIVGLYGINPTQMNNANGGGVVEGIVRFKGSGYSANATLTITQGNTAAANTLVLLANVVTANASANATGRATINISNFGNAINSNTGAPTLSVALPTAQTFNANSLVSANGQIAIGSTIFQNNDFVQYLVAAGNTAVSPLVNAISYYVVGANSSGLYLSLTSNGAVIPLVKGFTETGHSLTGQAPTGVLTVNPTNGAPFGNVSLTQSFFGSGYAANAVVTVNSTAVTYSTGRAIIQMSNFGNLYSVNSSPPVMTVAAPSAQTFNANSGVASNGQIAFTPNIFDNNDYVQYLVAAGNTALTGLVSGTSYFIVGANTSGVYLANTVNGAVITLTKGLTETGHSLTGQTAVGFLTINYANAAGNVNLTQTSCGSGYGANGVVTVNSSLSTGYLATGATGNAQSNATGYISNVNITANGTGYDIAHAKLIATIAAPAAQTFNASSGVTSNTYITFSGTNIFNAGDIAQYLVAAGNTAVSPLVNGYYYVVDFANSSVIGLLGGGSNTIFNPTGNNSTESGNSVLVGTAGSGLIANLNPGSSETGHTFTGQTAKAIMVIGGTPEHMSGVAHAGWNLVKIGTGGRAGRVMSECLVAMGSIGADSTNNAMFPSS